MPIHEYIDLPAAARAGKVPFVWSTDDQQQLEKLEVSNTIVHLVEERRRYWRTLQYLAGRHVEKLDADHHVELEALQHRYEESVARARVLARLDRPGDERTGGGVEGAPGALVGRAGAVRRRHGRPRPRVRRRQRRRRAATANGGMAAGLLFIRDEDVAKCVNCKTCYQQVPELFEMTTMVIDGKATEVGRMIPGVLARIEGHA